MMNPAKILDQLAVMLLVITMVLIKFSNISFDNIICANVFLFTYALIGAFIGLVFLMVLHKAIPSYFLSADNKRGSVVLCYFFAITVLTIFTAYEYDIATARENLVEKTAMVIGKTPGMSNGSYLRLSVDGVEERFQPNEQEWKSIGGKSKLRLTVGEGKLGFGYIFKFEPLNSEGVAHVGAGSNEVSSGSF